MSHPKLVQCVCPQGHVLMYSLVNPKMEDAHAVRLVREIVRDAIVEMSRDSKRWFCVCGAPTESWTIEVAPQSENTQTGFDEMVSAGAQTKNQFPPWKRPTGMVSLN